MAEIERGKADGVFRGGGVKGLGLAGALIEFAQYQKDPTKRITEWVSCAGASAGAIIAAYLVVKRDKGVSDLTELLKDAPYGTFQDFPHGGVVFGGGPNLLLKHGLARGDAFREWFDGVVGGATFADVKQTVERDGKKREVYRLKVVAVDVTNRELLILPDDLKLYRRAVGQPVIDPDAFKVADAVRMSMSIPYFFEPVELVRDYVRCTDGGDTDYWAGAIVDRSRIEATNRDCETGGKKPATFEDVEQHTAYIVDGGTLSNFPVWIFDQNPGDQHDPSRPVRPTFGFTLRGGKGIGGGGHIVQHLPWIFRFGFDIFHAAQDAWDSRFASNSTRVRTVTVDAGDVATTEFQLPDDKKQMLLENGKQAAQHFLDNFEWANYVNTYGARLQAPPRGPGA